VSFSLDIKRRTLKWLDARESIKKIVKYVGEMTVCTVEGNVKRLKSGLPEF